MECKMVPQHSLALQIPGIQRGEVKEGSYLAREHGEGLALLGNPLIRAELNMPALKNMLWVRGYIIVRDLET